MQNQDDFKHSTYKTRLTEGDVRLFLEGKYGQVTGLVALKGGEVSQAFSYDVGGEKLLIRINKLSTNGFEKDMYVHDHYSSDEIPTPEILEIGKMDESRFYAISKRIEGEMMSSFENDVLEKLVPLSLKALDRIHLEKIDSSAGYGYWNPSGGAQYSSWKEMIINVGKDGPGKWDDLFHATCMERDVYDQLFKKLNELVGFCPEERHLIHGDFGFDNVLSDGKVVTGVIDWAESRYGDFLYDAAWLSFWPSGFDFGEAVAKHYEKNNIPAYDERMLCYQVYIALNSMRFYAESNQKDKYIWAKGRIAGLLKDDRCFLPRAE